MSLLKSDLFGSTEIEQAYGENDLVIRTIIILFIFAEKSIVEENRQLREQRICKVCMDSEVSIVFLPCGHLCCCPSCAPALRNCPICRQLIRGTVRIFLS